MGLVTKRRAAMGSAAAMILACLFGAVLILSILTGISVYRRVADRVDRSASQRVGISYLTARVHAFDEVNRVGIGQFGDSDCIYLYQTINNFTYETILYISQGQLMEMFCEQGWEQAPETGMEIVEAQDLKVEFLTDRLLHISYTDGAGYTETSQIYIRSGGGA